MKKKAELTFTYGGILKEIASLSKSEIDGFTVQELTKSLGRTKYWWREKLQALIAEGKAIHIGFKSVKMIDGRINRTPAYRLTAK